MDRVEVRSGYVDRGVPPSHKAIEDKKVSYSYNDARPTGDGQPYLLTTM